MKLWVDDERPMPSDFDLHVKTAQEAIEQIDTGKVSLISLDHDLGSLDFDKTGYAVASYIEAGAFSGKISRMELRVHSANPVGVKSIQMAFQGANKFWDRYDAM